MKKVLITGVAGFIGSNLADALVLRGIHVVGVDNFDPFYSRKLKDENLRELKRNPLFEFIEADICDLDCWASVAKVDVVFHLAAKAGVFPSISDVDGYIESNIKGTKNVLEYMKQQKVQNLVFASSSSVYGNNIKIPFSETDSVDRTISPYAFTKKSCEVLIHTYHHLYNINAMCLRFFTVYGPRQRPDLAIRKFTNLILNDKPIEMYGDGSSARDYTYIDDTVSGVLQSADFLTSVTDLPVYEVVNLGNHYPVKLKYLINLIYQSLGKTQNVVEKEMQVGDVTITFADIQKAKKMLGYKPNVTLEEGLKKFHEWYIASNLNTIQS